MKYSFIDIFKCILLIYSTNAFRLVQFYHRDVLDGHICQGNDVVFTTRVTSAVHCSSTCLGHGLCLTWFFDVQQCTGCSNMYSDTEALLAAGNMVAYTAKNTVDPTTPVANYVNVALGKTVSMSGVHSSVSPGTLLVDGDRSFIWPCASTPLSTDPYMVIDLGQLFTITHMFIVNRGDCCAERLHDLWISFGQTLDLMGELVHIPGVFGPQGTIQLIAPVTIRYIHITILDYEFLTICEFEVWNALI